MDKSIDEEYLETRIKMKEFDQLLNNTELPEGVYMHNTTGRIEQRINHILRQAWLEIADAASVVEAIGKPKTDA